MRCSELSLDLDEPLAGSAPHVPRWQLVLHDGPWSARAVDDAGVVAEAGAKPLLVRGGIPDGRVFLVCTNGARDPCCALKGAPVVRALGGRARECSHVGGHRFAANVLVLPDALMFGRVDPDTALGLADALDAGRLPLAHLRGRTTLAPDAQAAEILLRQELSLHGLDEVRHAAGTTFDTPRGRVDVRVRGEALPPRRVSCRDGKEESPLRWELEDLVFA